MYDFSKEWITSNSSFLRPDQGHDREKTSNPRKFIPSTRTQINLSTKVKKKMMRKYLPKYK
jgi:hypothetical protein